MINVTENAKKTLKKKLLSYAHDSTWGLRLSLKSKGSIGLILDRQTESDEVIEYDGAKILLVAGKMTSLFDGVTVDVRNTSEGPLLVIFK